MVQMIQEPIGVISQGDDTTFAIAWDKFLDDGETVSSIQTVEEITDEDDDTPVAPSDLTLTGSTIPAQTGVIHGKTRAIGEWTLHPISGAQQGSTYIVKVTILTNASRVYSQGVRIVCV